MDLAKIGKFIAEQRKSKKLTQVQLAEKLMVSEKTISKWECGHGFPDTSLILPLCKELGISANELLSGKNLSNNDYKEKAEENLLKLTNQEVYKNKLLLSLEWVIVTLSVMFLLSCSVIAYIANISDGWKIAIVVFGFLGCFAGCVFSIIIEKDAGYYMCSHCHHKHIPSYNQIFWSMHIGRTRYIKCPKCKKVGWQKKTAE